MSRAQLDHVLLDVDFFNNPKIRALKGKFGHISQLCLIDAYTAMSRATNAIIDGDCVMAILFDYQLKWDFWEHCLDKGLVKIEGQGYSNSRVIQDQEKLGRSQDKWRVANGKRKGDLSSTTNLHPINAQSKQNTVNAHGCEVLNTEELNIDTNKNSQIQKPDFSHYEPSEREKLEKADSMLEPCDAPKVQRSNQFISAGRRPMLKWSNIWLSPQELVQVIDSLVDEGIDGKKRKQVFDSVQSRIATKLVQGVGIEKISAFNWLTGFEITETLKQIKAKKDLDRSEEYLTNARS